MNKIFSNQIIDMISDILYSRDIQVMTATQILLTESAHKTLNDPEILDHSMEFAADVVGDDVVQRTSGEALWNTISYSFRPGFSYGKHLFISVYF